MLIQINQFTKHIATLLVITCYSALAGGISSPEPLDPFDLSLEELLNVKVSTGGLTQILVKNSSSALTIIRKDQIQISPAKNLSTLLEQYVPGLIVMEHSEGSKIGMRGLIAAENYKLLLLVNSKI